MSFTANYSLKLDTLGSTFKTVANYTYRNKEDSVYYHTNYSGMMNYDSTFALHAHRAVRHVRDTQRFRHRAQQKLQTRYRIKIPTQHDG